MTTCSLCITEKPDCKQFYGVDVCKECREIHERAQETIRTAAKAKLLKRLSDSHSETEKMIVEIISETAAKAALNHSEQQKRRQFKSRHDKRLRNTKLLLKKYELLKDHCENAIYEKEQRVENEYGYVIDILDSLDDTDATTYIHSIKQSVARTKLILAHIDQMVMHYGIYCERTGKPEDMRRYRILKAVYFPQDDNAKPSREAICKQEDIEERTFFRDMEANYNRLSALIFGIDGLSQKA
ncbi:hypothetical protein [Sporomusa sphaeroides]|uniref:DUF4428 domain-containing protein n=1 Tax=Sporomusa sphaeroides DSM 2875 TaxID=1337886 RepID=A0ABP2C7V4_9FIRM|nr:hypothetical protein [Sporomusa sphaeroides]OLS56380.1 hypothetical protein SPSPH_27730 [Sporomusa sphaeroides DSM 2875]CVK18475.1 hypothetical protein SSPH_01113 [Sporomusa sphaeroides DSM 2875]